MAMVNTEAGIRDLPDCDFAPKFARFIRPLSPKINSQAYLIILEQQHSLGSFLQIKRL